MPFPEMEGVTAGPGHAYTISLKSLLHARLGDHFRECSKNNREINMYSEWFGVKYSQQAKIEQLTSSARQRYVDDMTKTEIYFEDLNWHSYTQSPSYTVDKWLSHVGGTFGLWLGCSVFTIIETLELIYDLIIFVLIRLKK
ncbi:hypothetical protein CAPTEDRAFT_187791 [Capitella teleta]|uniref:Uncharacterized protein n=1 Tax=Capitella teleta TaxID=283909 RepID=R7TGS9_CAPTE|nr:hypothetical protein CAPTEDRAFT_187791 [Capitella teleta]|eukprot:ELT92697.1 hypothetical protein CAPTEDRAFT_187791 [Capitella teleta]